MNQLFKEFLRTTFGVVPTYLVVTYVMGLVVLTKMDQVAELFNLTPSTFVRFWITLFLMTFALYIVVSLVIMAMLHLRLLEVSYRTGLTYSAISYAYIRLKLFKEKKLANWTASWVTKRYKARVEAEVKRMKNRAAFKQRYRGSHEFMLTKSASD